MKKQQQLGLVVEGKTNDSSILRLSGIAERIGPVKSRSVGVATRVSNFLNAGYAVTRFEDLQAAQTILLHFPDGALPRTMQDLCDSGIALNKMTFVLCESWLASDSLAPLAAHGATVGTVVQVAAPSRNWFVVEGQPAATRHIRRVIEQSGDVRAFEVHAKAKPLYFAAELLATALTEPLFLAAEQALRAGGISGNHLRILLREIAEKSFRDLLKGGHRNWGGPLTQCSPEVAQAHLAAVRAACPSLAEVIDRQVAWASQRMQKRDGSLQNNPAPGP